MLIRIPRPQPRVVELEDEGAFAVAIQQAEAIRRNALGRLDRRQKVHVIVQVSHDGRRWLDYEEWWSGYWEPHWNREIPRPTQQELREVAKPSGYRHAQAVIRSTI